MKKHSLLLSISSILSTAVLLHVLFSCSGKKSTEEDVSEAEASEIISEEGSTDEETISDNSEQKNENMSELESTVGDKSEDEALTADSGENKESEGLVADDETKAESLGSLEDNNLAANTPPAESTAETIPEPSGEVPSLPAEVPVAKTQKKPAKRKAYIVGTAPRIPGKALEKADGTKLNRFYFVRKGDNPKKISELLYGKNSHAQDLQKWNPGPFVPGKLIFYSSPLASDDTKMQSFYQERSIPFEPHTVGPKESIYQVATKKLGDARSWKEIAVLNGLEKADQVQAGQKLEIHPWDLKSVASPLEKPKVAEQPTPQPEVAQQPNPVPDPNIGVPPPVANNPAPAPVTAEASRETGGGIGEIISQNLLPIVVGGALIVFLILLAAVSKRNKKKTMSDDFGDEGFSAPPKLKKRK